jgi:structural maintenance of chromosome 4
VHGCVLSHLGQPRAQDDERYEVVPSSSFTISRTAHRNNASAYFINDRKSNFTEVTDLLKGKGVDLDNNRFLILQVRPGTWST